MLIPEMHLIKSLMISDFPSGSSINYHNERLYLIGDDSRNVLILDKDYNRIDSVHLFDFTEKRIPKADKIDLEGSVILAVDNTNHLLIVGSASRKNRKRIILIPFSDAGLEISTLKHSIHKTKAFVKRIKAAGIEEINLEGVTVLNDDLVLGNRGNRSNQHNHLIVTVRNFWEQQDDAKLLIAKLTIPADLSQVALGLSELCYISELDLLLATFTSEHTANAYDDGEIGGSYIGLIKNATAKLRGDEVTPDHMIDLSDVSSAFKNEKIEGVCVEMITKNEIILHLISDNDNGESRLFKVKMDITSWLHDTKGF